MNLSDIEFGKTRVTHSNFDSGEGTVIAEASRLYSEGEDRVSVKWDTPARHLTNISATHQVSYLEAVAPAPLDPSKVKAGDTVTLVSPASVNRGTVSVPAKIEGVVREVLPDGRIAVHGVQGFFFPSTLTAHQPAPEPEPEWEPGTVHAVRLAGGADHFHAWVIDLDEGARAFMDDGGNSWAPGELHDIRPLVVIDTDVVDELVDSLSHALGERLPPDAVAYISRTDGNNDRRKWVRGLLSHAQPNLIRSPLQILGLDK